MVSEIQADDEEMMDQLLRQGFLPLNTPVEKIGKRWPCSPLNPLAGLGCLPQRFIAQNASPEQEAALSRIQSVPFNCKQRNLKSKHQLFLGKTHSASQGCNSPARFVDTMYLNIYENMGDLLMEDEVQPCLLKVCPI